MEAGAEAEQGGSVRLTGEKQPLGRSGQLGAAQDMIVAPRAGEGNLGSVSNPVQQQEVNAHSLQGASFNARPVVDGAAGLGQLQGLPGMGTGQPLPPKAPPVFAAGAQQQSRNQGQAGQRNASATARPPGTHFPASFMPANLPLGGHSDVPSQRGGSAAMQPSRSPFRAGSKQPGGPASGDAPGMWGAPKPAARQLSSPGRRSDALPGPHPVGQQTLRHPAPRFLGGGSQPGSAVLRQPLGYGVHLMAQDGSAGKAHQPPGARQGLPSQAGLPSRGSAVPGTSPSPGWPPAPAAAPSSQLPSPRLIVRSMDPSQVRALSPPGRPTADGAQRKPARHLDFGAQQYGMPAVLPDGGAHLGTSPPRRLFPQAPLPPGGSPARPAPSASPFRGLRSAPEKPEPPPKKKQCNCKNSRCLKLYCECFASGNYCGPECNCLSCCNNAENEATRQEAVEATLERNPNAFRPKIAPSPDVKSEQEGAADGAFPTDTAATEAPVAGQHHKGCHCKKSGCLKKYCECFQANVLCTDACKCIDCKNYDGSDERRLLFATPADPPQAPPGYAAPSPPPYKKARLQERALQSPPQAKAGQGGSAGRGMPGSSYPPGRGPQKPLTRSLLSGVVKADAVQELCKLLAIVTQEVANNFEAQHPGLLAAQQQRQEAAFAAAAASAASALCTEGGRPGRDDGASAMQEDDGDAGRSSAGGEGPGPGEDEEQSAEALLLSCDEELPAEKEVQVALPGGLYAGGDDAGSEGGAARLYALQEQTVLEEFASCLKKIISVGQKRMRQYEESLAPLRPAYSGPPPLHYRPPPPSTGSVFSQRFPAGQAPPAPRQPGGPVRYVPQYHQQPPAPQRGQAAGQAQYRPAYQHQQQQQQQQQQRHAGQPGKQASYRPTQHPPPGWLHGPPALGQPVPRPPFSGVAQGPAPLLHPLPPQRHPAVRPTRQSPMRALAPPTFAHHLRPGLAPSPGFHVQGPRLGQLAAGPAAQHHPAALRAGAPVASATVAAPSPTVTFGTADTHGGRGSGLR